MSGGSGHGGLCLTLLQTWQPREQSSSGSDVKDFLSASSDTFFHQSTDIGTQSGLVDEGGAGGCRRVVAVERSGVQAAGSFPSRPLSRRQSP